MKNSLRLRALFAATAATAVLAACGGGGGGDAAAPPAATTGIPASATGDSAGLLAYLNDLIGSMTNDSGEPVLVGDASLPTSDTTEAAN